MIQLVASQIKNNSSLHLPSIEASLRHLVEVRYAVL